jgi:hypothetical protein
MHILNIGKQPLFTGSEKGQKSILLIPIKTSLICFTQTRAMGSFKSLHKATINNQVFLKVPQLIHKALIFYYFLGTQAKVSRKLYNCG